MAMIVSESMGFSQADALILTVVALLTGVPSPIRYFIDCHFCQVTGRLVFTRMCEAH